MIPVKSSNIEAVGWHAATHTLHVQFKGSGYYTYENVPHATYLELLKADSPGEHFHHNIKGLFKHKRAA